MKAAKIALAAGAMAIGVSGALAAPAQADPDTDFANQLHTYGIYGQRDFNAWIGKIACKRLERGLDADAYASAKFISAQLQRGTDTAQTWQFLGAAISFYCPDKTYVLQQAAERQ